MVPSLIITALTWIDAHPLVHVAVGNIAFAILASVAVRPFLLPKTPPPQGSRFWETGIFLVLLAGRWPTLFVTREFSPDESQQIVGAITLSRDVVFWRSVDGATAGPLNFYLLLPTIAAIPGYYYFQARLWALFLIWVALASSSRSLEKLVGTTPARLAILPIVAIEAFSHETDFLHYSTELLSIALISLAILAFLSKRPLISAILLGCVPFAKLQAAPIAFALGLVLLYATKGRRLTIVLASTSCLLSVSLMLLATGEWRHALTPYLYQNLVYTSEGLLTLAATARALYRTASADAMAYTCGLFVLSIIVPCGLSFLRQLRRRDLFTWFALGLTAIALLCILLPRRPFIHYLQLLLIPSAWLACASLATAQTPPRKRLMGCISLAGCCLLLAINTARAPAYIGDLAAFWRTPRVEVADVILDKAGSGSYLAIWGWLPALYVMTGMPQATRQAHSEFQIRPGPLRDYYRQIYLTDLQTRKPPIFVDSVGPKDWAARDRAAVGHESWDELKDYIAINYDFLNDIDGCRLYLIKPQPSLRPDLGEKN